MINPIIIITAAALLLAVIAVCIINKPKKPVITGTVILILICFVVFTFVIDNSISALGTKPPNSFVCFLTMNEAPDYEELATSFRTFMTIDMGLIVFSLASLFFEILLILRKDSKK